MAVGWKLVMDPGESIKRSGKLRQMLSKIAQAWRRRSGGVVRLSTALAFSRSMRGLRTSSWFAVGREKVETTRAVAGSCDGTPTPVDGSR